MGSKPPDQAGGQKSRPWLRWILPGLLIPFVTLTAWLEPDEEDLFELCSTQGKPTIYRRVAAEGYFDGAGRDCWGCWNNLSNSGYKFVEFPITVSKVWGPINTPGIYRASRIRADSPLCDAKLTAFYTRMPPRKDEFERNGWCFQLQRFESRRARYGYYLEGLGTLTRSPITGSSISASRIYFLDHETNEVLADSTDYGLTKYPIFQISSFRTRRVCNDFVDQLGIRGINRQEVIIPLKELRK